MSDRNRTTENSELPEELKRLEGQLRQTPLPPAQLDRDATMYRVGYAAAERDLGRPRLRVLAWPIASAAAACLATVLAMWPAAPVEEGVGTLAVMEQPVSVNPSEEPVVSKDVSRDAVVIDEVDRVWPPRRQWSASAPMLALRDRVLRAEWDDLRTNGFAGSGPTTEPATARELLHELLPNNNAPAALPVFWNLRHLGTQVFGVGEAS